MSQNFTFIVNVFTFPMFQEDIFLVNRQLWTFIGNWNWNQLIEAAQLYKRKSEFSLSLENFSLKALSSLSMTLGNDSMISFLCLFSDDKTGTLDGALDNLYCRSQMYLSRQMSRLRPELTMPIFSGLY